MQTRSDAELLREYASHQSESAFGEIVNRYADVVYSAALRQVGNAEQARDVAQTVFAALARKAASLPANVLLLGWLYRGARLAALEQLRKDHRREQRERIAMQLHDASPDVPNDWTTVRPVLDEAIATLGHEDRDALLLRFFKNESLASVGASLGVSEDAAQKRVSRALDKVREFLAGRGIHSTATALSAVLMANAVQAAPPGFAGALTAGALAKTAVAGGSGASLSSWFTLNWKFAVLIAALAGGLAVTMISHSKTQRRLGEARALIEQQAADLEALRAANEEVAALQNELARIREDAADVLRLRGEVARLRRDLAALPAVASTNHQLVAPPESVNQMQVTIKAKFFSVRGEYAPSHGLLTEPQAKLMMESFEKRGDVTLLSESQVTTLNGRQAQMHVSLEQPGRANLIIDVIPTCTTNSPFIDLQLAVSILKMVTPEPMSKFEMPPGTSLPLRAFLQVESLVQVTNIVWDGQTVFLSRPISASDWPADTVAASDEPRTLWILVTPFIIDAEGTGLFTTEQVAQQTEAGHEKLALQFLDGLHATAEPVFPGAPPSGSNELRVVTLPSVSGQVSPVIVAPPGASPTADR